MTIPMEALDFKGGSDEGRRLGRRFRRSLSKKTVPTKAVDWEIVPTTVPPVGTGSGRRFRGRLWIRETVADIIRMEEV
jgi:hypothetical protein